MGVSGLWEILEGTSQSIPISQLALTGFNSPHTPSPYALRIGIDASLWIFHATRQSSHTGLNPFQRLLFFKTLKLLAHPILPLFVFDGPHKPCYKRGIKVAGKFGTSDQWSRKFKQLLDDMGLEYWTAPGEAEAELAHLSKIGRIDAVLTDDVDALVFGSTKILRNTSRTLSSNNRLTYDNVEDFQLYSLTSITSPSASSSSSSSSSSNSVEMNEPDPALTGKKKWNGLSVDGMIFIALCSGGDYHPAGIPSCGPKIAHGLAQTPLAADLITNYRLLPPSAFQTYLETFRQSLKHELCTNSLGFLPNKRKQLAASIGESFPQLEIIEYYVNPRVSGEEGGWKGFGSRPVGTPGAGKRGGRGDPRSFALTCEKYFEWGTKEEVGRRMKTLVWRGEVINQLRERLIEQQEERMGKQKGKRDGKVTSYFPSTSSSQTSSYPSGGKDQRSRTPVSGGLTGTDDPVPFPRAQLIKIHSQRQHASTGMILEYRVEYDPKPWTKAVHEVMEGTRIDPNLLPEEERIALGLTTGAATKDREGSVTSETNDEEPAPLTQGKGKTKKDVDDHDRIWIPAELLKRGWPDLVEAYEQRQREKALPKTPKRTKKTVDALASQKASTARSGGRKQRVVPAGRIDGWTSDDELEETPRSLLQGWLGSGSGSTLRNTSSPRLPVVSPSNRQQRGSCIDLVDSPESLPKQSRLLSSIPPVSSSPSVLATSKRRNQNHTVPAPASESSGDDWVSPRQLFRTEKRSVAGTSGLASTAGSKTPSKPGRRAEEEAQTRTPIPTRTFRKPTREEGVIEILSSDDEADGRQREREETPEAIEIDTTPKYVFVPRTTTSAVRSSPFRDNHEDESITPRPRKTATKRTATIGLLRRSSTSPPRSTGTIKDYFRIQGKPSSQAAESGKALQPHDSNRPRREKTPKIVKQVYALSRIEGDVEYYELRDV